MSKKEVETYRRKLNIKLSAENELHESLDFQDHSEIAAAPVNILNNQIGSKDNQDSVDSHDDAVNQD